MLLETGDTGIIELVDYFSKGLVSLIDHRGMTHDDQDGQSNLNCLGQNCDDTVKTVNITLPDVDSYCPPYNDAYAYGDRRKYNVGRFPASIGPDFECQTAAETVRLRSSLFKSVQDGVLARLASVDGAFLKYAPGALLALYFISLTIQS